MNNANLKFKKIMIPLNWCYEFIMIVNFLNITILNLPLQLKCNGYKSSRFIQNNKRSFQICDTIHNFNNPPFNKTVPYVVRMLTALYQVNKKILDRKIKQIFYNILLFLSINFFFIYCLCFSKRKRKFYLAEF